MARNYAALPYEYLEDMEALSDAEFGRLCRSLIIYSATGEPIALSGNERFYAKRVMRIEDSFKETYQARVKNGSQPKKSKSEQTEANRSKVEQTEEEPSEIDKTKTKTKTKNISAIADNIDSDESICSTAVHSDVQKAVKAWNALGLGQVTKISAGSERYKLLQARLREYGFDGWLHAVDEIRHSKWLQGNGNKGWVITFDWFIKPNNFPKVHDGNYRDSSAPEQQATNSNPFLALIAEGALRE